MCRTVRHKTMVAAGRRAVIGVTGGRSGHGKGKGDSAATFHSPGTIRLAHTQLIAARCHQRPWHQWGPAGSLLRETEPRGPHRESAEACSRPQRPATRHFSMGSCMNSLPLHFSVVGATMSVHVPHLDRAMDSPWGGHLPELPRSHVRRSRSGRLACDRRLRQLRRYCTAARFRRHYPCDSVQSSEKETSWLSLEAAAKGSQPDCVQRVRCLPRKHLA